MSIKRMLILLGTLIVVAVVIIALFFLVSIYAFSSW